MTTEVNSPKPEPDLKIGRREPVSSRTTSLMPATTGTDSIRPVRDYLNSAPWTGVGP